MKANFEFFEKARNYYACFWTNKCKTVVISNTLRAGVWYIRASILA